MYFTLGLFPHVPVSVNFCSSGLVSLLTSQTKQMRQKQLYSQKELSGERERRSA